jgi:hypothetical protein
VGAAGSDVENTESPVVTPQGSARSGRPDGATAAASRKAPRWRPSAGFAAVTAVIALISAIIGLVFDLWPSLRPDPRTELGSEVTVLEVHPYVTMREFLRRTTVSTSQYRRRLQAEMAARGGSREALEIPGYMAYVRISARGFKRRRLSMHWFYIDPRSRRRQRTHTWRPTSESVAGEAPNDEFVAELWLPPIFDRRLHLLRIEIRNPDGGLLAIDNSRAFRGLK